MGKLLKQECLAARERAIRLRERAIAAVDEARNTAQVTANLRAIVRLQRRRKERRKTPR
jgi:hypothetical protein